MSEQKACLVEGLTRLLEGDRTEDEQIERVTQALLILMDVHRSLVGNGATVAQLQRALREIKGGKKPRFNLQAKEV